MNFNNRLNLLAMLAVSATLYYGSAFAGIDTTRVVVLDFELNDLSMQPGKSIERERTASSAPLLRDALRKTGRYEIVEIASARQQQANAGAGYLYAHPESAAALGSELQADWVLVGRLQKSNDLFAYLTVSLVNVRSQQRAGEFNTEIKGPVTNTKLTERGVTRLADQVMHAMQAAGANSAH